MEDVSFWAKEKKVVTKKGKGFILGTLLLALCLEGCGGGDGGNGGTQSGEPIDSSRKAKSALETVYGGFIKRNVMDGMSQGNKNSYAVKGSQGGTATVTGRNNYEPSRSCGSSCIRSVRDVSFTIVFDKYRVKTNDNTVGTISGTMRFTDNSWSRQSGYSYRSGGGMSISGTDIQYHVARDDGGNYEVSDIITFNANLNTSGYITSGSVSTVSGGNYKL